MLKIHGRIIISVDDVDIEQAGIEHGISTERDKAIAAAMDQPDIQGIKRLCERTGNVFRVVKARAGVAGSWRVIFTIGKMEKINGEADT